MVSIAEPFNYRIFERKRRLEEDTSGSTPGMPCLSVEQKPKEKPDRLRRLFFTKKPSRSFLQEADSFCLAHALHAVKKCAWRSRAGKVALTRSVPALVGSIVSETQRIFSPRAWNFFHNVGGSVCFFFTANSRKKN